MSHVTVSGGSEGEAKGITCKGFCGLEGEGTKCHMQPFLGLGKKRKGVTSNTKQRKAKPKQSIAKASLVVHYCDTLH